MLKPTLAASLLFTALIAGQTANAADGQYLDNKGDRIEERLDDKGDRIDTRLDNKGDRIDERLDRKSDFADANGKERLADKLDRKGDRIDAVRKAAEELGMHKTTLYRRLRILGINLPDRDGRSVRKHLDI